MKPRARADVIARPIGEEVVVYDPLTHEAHCLNRTAALVFGAADGRTSVPRLAARLAQETRLQVDEDVVWASLERLAEAHLLEAPLPSRPVEPSRRSVMRRVGIAALVPVVASLVVPTPAEAANTCIPYAACNTANFGQPCWITVSTECPGVRVCQGTDTGTTSDCQ